MWKEFFGATVHTKNGVVDTDTALANKKRVGVYFSAHWCPPCRKFTPVLGEFYERAKAADADGLEIIFVSADSDEDSFEEYWGSMPFCATQFGSRANDELNERFGVNGIPAFIVLDSHGKVKDANARATVTMANGNVESCFAKW